MTKETVVINIQVKWNYVWQFQTSLISVAISLMLERDNVHILILYLSQFAIVATATAKKSCRGCSCFESEIWSLVALLFLDDAPFLAFRLVCIIKFELKGHNNYFFAAKNILVLALDVNRIIALYKEKRKMKRRHMMSTELNSIPHRPSLSHIRRWIGYRSLMN